MTNPVSSKSENPREKPCHLCGKSEFTWGSLLVGKVREDNKSSVFFRPEGATVEDGDMKVYARHCDVCGNVLVFTVDS